MIISVGGVSVMQPVRKADRIVSAVAVDGYGLRVKFESGFEGVITLDEICAAAQGSAQARYENLYSGGRWNNFEIIADGAYIEWCNDYRVWCSGDFIKEVMLPFK